MAQEKLTVNMDAATFDRLVVALKRDMFLAGLCFGMALVGLGALGAYGILGAGLAAFVIWVAMRAWPWEL